MSVLPIEYRALPSCLTTPRIVAELLWLADAPTWRGQLGDYARARRDALRTELRRRRAR